MLSNLRKLLYVFVLYLIVLVVVLLVVPYMAAQEAPKADQPGVVKLEPLEAAQWQNFLLSRTLLKEQIGRYTEQLGKLRAQAQVLEGVLKEGKVSEEKIDSEFQQKWNDYAKKFQMNPDAMQYKPETGEFAGPIVKPQEKVVP